MSNFTVKRRAFLKVSTATSGSLLFGFNWLGACSPKEEQSAFEGEFSPNGFIKIAGDGLVTLMAPNPEIGQGIKTAMPLVVAEELDVDWDKVNVEQAGLDNDKYQRQVAGGSGSIRSSWDTLRKAGATVRQMMKEAAAKKWEVAPEECTTDKGQVIHSASGKKIFYQELLSEVANMPVPEDAPLKETSDFKLLGTRIRNVDNKKIATGQQPFGYDLKREGMVIAMVVRPPAFGQTLKDFDATETKAMPGIVDVVSFDNKVAVVGKTTWQVKKGRDKLKINWETPGKLEDTKTYEEAFRKLVRQDAEKPARKDGEIKIAFQKPLKTIEGVYEAPFLPHSAMEPMNFFADVKEGSVELLGPIQTPDRARKDVSEMLNIPEENISVMMTRMGGGFGRRLYTDFVKDAAMVSSLVKAPAKVVWTREDDTTAGIYRPAALYHYRASIDEDGNLAGWHVKAAGANTGNPTRQDNFPAGAVPHFQVDTYQYESKITVGAWRAPNHNFVAFSDESFLDEIIHSLGKDPVAYRLQLLDNAKSNPGGEVKYDPDRYKAVIEKVAEMANWGKKNTNDGIFQGFGSHFSFGTYVAQIAEVSVKNGQLKVHKVYCAVDCGIVVNLSGAETQIEGGIIDGLGHAMFGELTFTNGKPDKQNFDKHRMIRINETPEIEVAFIKSEERPMGMGEPGLPPIPAAVGNAIFAATGKRIRKLPFINADLS